MEKATNILTVFSEWVTNLFLLQIYWLGGTLIGGIVFGIVPSSIALFSTIRKLFRESKDLNVFDHFKIAYKSNFKNSFVIGFLYLVISLFIYSYYLFLTATKATLFAYTHIFIYAFLFLLIIFSFYLIPVYIHFEMDMRALILNTFRILLTNMKWNIPMLLTVIAILLVYIKFSVSLLFFGVSLPAFAISFFCREAFQDFQEKQKGLN